MKQTTTTIRDAKRVPPEYLIIFVAVAMFAALVVFLVAPCLPLTRAEVLSLAAVAGGVFAFCLAAGCDLCERFAE